MNVIQEPWIWEAPCLSSIEYAREQWMKNKVEELCDDIAKRGESADKDLYDLIWIHIEDNIEKYTDEVCYE